MHGVILRAARRGLGLAAALAALNIAACGPRPGAEDRFLVRQAAIDPPELWRAEVLDDAGRARGAVYVCADRQLRDGFTRAGAEVNGDVCVEDRPPIERPGLHAARCTAAGRRFSVSVVRRGDPGRDLTVGFALRPLDRDAPAVRQTLRYRRVGEACPAGWKIGDQARPGARPGANVLGG